MKTDKYRFLNGYNPDLEIKKEAYFALLISTDDREIRKYSARGMASLTSIRSPEFVKALERVRGLRND